MQVPRPAVIAEPRPQLQDAFPPGARELADARENAEEAVEVGDNGRHLGLLEHDLRDPYSVGGPLTAPGKRPGVRSKPPE